MQKQDMKQHVSCGTSSTSDVELSEYPKGKANGDKLSPIAFHFIFFT